jgi:DNA-binding transcriptional regulator YiaG
LGISQRELAVLTGVSLGAAHQWETGKFRPKDEKKKVLVALRKLGRREVRRLLEEKAAGRVEK